MTVRVTFVLPSDASTGGVRVVYEYADRLIERGHDVTVVVPRVPPYPLRLLREQGPLAVGRKALDASESGGATGWGTEATVRRVPMLRRPFLDRVPEGDVVVATSWRSAPAVSRLPRSAGRPFHLVQHYEAWRLWDDERCWRRAERLADRRDLPIPAAMAAIDPGTWLRGYKRRVDDALSLPTRKLVVTEWLGTALDRVFGQGSTGIPNGIDHGTFYPDPGPEDSTDTLRVLAPYRTAAWKGAADAVEAFRRVRRERDDVRFGMFGPSGGESELPPWVEFYGRVPDSRLRQLYSDADVFVFPSWVEGFGLPPLEAMACGTAVVSTDVGVVRESTDGGVVTVPPRDPDALGEALAGLLADPERRAAVASVGRGSVDRFRWRDSVSALETALADGYSAVGPDRDSAVDAGDRDSAAGHGRDSAVGSTTDAGRGGRNDGPGDIK